jgi:alpha-D-ribose 1-methylphosphonate 5-triphosphate diphosphatase PhnM
MNTFIINNVRIVTEYGIIENGFIYVKRGIIMNVGRTAPGRIHRSCSIIDGNGGWLLPGVIDISNEQLAGDDQYSFCSIEKNLSSHGITSVFHMTPGYEETGDNRLEQLRRLGIIRHHFRTNLPVLNPYYIVGAAAVCSETESAILGPDVSAAGHHPPHNPTISDMASNPSIYIICGDSVKSPIVQSVYVLHHFYGMRLTDAVGMVSLNPARAIGLDKRLGSIEWGKRADLVLTTDNSDSMEISKVFVSGCIVYNTEGSEINENQNNHFKCFEDGII